MARFGRCAEVLLLLDCLLAALFVWPGLTVPPATSVSPPSDCIAQAAVYQHIALFQAYITATLVSSALLYVLIRVEVALNGNDTMAGMHPYARRFLRGCMALAILLSAATVGLGLRVYAYVLEAKVQVFACLSFGVRFTFLGTYALTGLIGSYVFARFVHVVLVYE